MHLIAKAIRISSVVLNFIAIDLDLHKIIQDYATESHFWDTVCTNTDDYQEHNVAMPAAVSVSVCDVAASKLTK